LEGAGQIEYPDPSGRGRARRRLGLILGLGHTDTARASRNPALAAQIPDLAAVRAAFAQRPAPKEPAFKEPRRPAGHPPPPPRRRKLPQ
jgi:hypothetical protein